MRKVLMKRERVFDVVATGEEAFSLSRILCIQLLITDMIMPRIISREVA